MFTDNTSKPSAYGYKAEQVEVNWPEAHYYAKIDKQTDQRINGAMLAVLSSVALMKNMTAASKASTEQLSRIRGLLISSSAICVKRMKQSELMRQTVERSSEGA